MLLVPEGLHIAALDEAGKDGSFWREAYQALRLRAQAAACRYSLVPRDPGIFRLQKLATPTQTRQ